MTYKHMSRYYLLQSRAEVATELLQELNEDAHGDFVDDVSAQRLYYIQIAMFVYYWIDPSSLKLKLTTSLSRLFSVPNPIITSLVKEVCFQ